MWRWDNSLCRNKKILTGYGNPIIIVFDAWNKHSIGEKQRKIKADEIYVLPADYEEFKNDSIVFFFCKNI